MGTDVNFSSFGRSFQEKIIQALLTDHAWAQNMSEVVDTNYFDLQYLKFLAEKYFSYYATYRSFPTMQLLVTIIKDDLRTGTDIILRDQIIDFLQRIKSNPDMGDLDYVKDKAFDFCRKQAFKEALEKSVDLIHKDEFDSVIELLRNAMNVGVTPSIGHDFKEDMEARFVKVNRHACPTGIEELDKRGILNGGLGRGELGVIVASAGVGKSHFLTMLGANALRLGKNVLHYTLELSEIAVGLRYDSNITNIPSDEIQDRKEEVKSILSKTDMGRLIIKEYPTSSVTVAMLRGHIDKLSLKGFIPNVILIDYADIMRSSREYDSLRHELKLIYEELRRMSSELNVPIWTASQSNKEGADSDFIDLKNMSEAYAKAAVADCVLTLQRKAQEKATGLGKLYIAKNRAGRDGLLFPIKLDTALSKITFLSSENMFELDEPTSEKQKLTDAWNRVTKDRSFNLEKV